MKVIMNVTIMYGVMLPCSSLVPRSSVCQILCKMQSAMNASSPVDLPAERDSLSRVLCELQHEISFRYLTPEGDRSRLMTQGAAYQRYPVAVHRNVPAYAEGRAFSPRALLCLRSAQLHFSVR